MGLHFKVGLKLYSTDVALIPDALKHQDRFFNFIELYIVPGSFAKTIEAWRDLDVPYVIHAPHSLHGVNLAQPEKWEANLKHFNEARLFADDLSADIIIVHGGNNGPFEETVRQMRLLNEKRTVLENKPKLGLCNEVCIGCSPLEFQQMAEAGVLYGTALDFTHAAYAAHSLGIKEMEVIKGFMVFNPKVFHLSDGDASSEKDVHLNLGKGNLNLAEFVSMIPYGALVTIETPRNELGGLKDIFDDVHFLQHLLSQQH